MSTELKAVEVEEVALLHARSAECFICKEQVTFKPETAFVGGFRGTCGCGTWAFIQITFPNDLSTFEAQHPYGIIGVGRSLGDAITWTSEKGPKDKRLRIWERDRGCCWICGRPVSYWEMTLDHFIPKSKGGSNDEDNLRASHEACNNARGNGDPPKAKKRNKRRHKGGKRKISLLSTEDRISLQKRDE